MELDYPGEFFFRGLYTTSKNLVLPGVRLWEFFNADELFLITF